MRRLLVVCPLVLVAAFATAVLFASSAAAIQPECKVINQTQEHVTYNSNTTANPLVEAIEEAVAGDTLKVIGTCRGSFAINKHLTLTGRPSGHWDTLDGGGAGRVLYVAPDVTVEIAHLAIVNGQAPYPGGGGIYNQGSLTLRDSLVSENGQTGSYPVAGGIRSSGTLTLVGSSAISGNTAEQGGGIYIDAGTATLNDSSTVSSNSVTWYGAGILVGSDGTLTLNDNSSVVGNASEYAGGGIYNASSYWDGGTVIMNDRSTVSDNRAGYGGGVHNSGGGLVDGTLTLNDNSSITGNTATITGGGVYNGGVLVLNGGTVTGNTPNDVYP